MVKIYGKSEEFIEAFTFLGASPDTSTAGFDPLLLSIKNGKASVETPNIPRTAFVIGEFKVKHQGEGQMVIDVKHVMSRLKKFFSGTEVEIDYNPETGKMTISNDAKTSITYPPAIGDCNAMPLPFKRNEKGIVLFGKENPKKPTTKVKIDAKELAQLIPQANEVLVDYYQFTFRPDGVSESWIGDENDKTKSPMHTILNCSVKGKEAYSQYSDGFPEIASVLKGEVSLYLMPNSPIWIVQKWESGKVEYLIAPRVDDE